MEYPRWYDRHVSFQKSEYQVVSAPRRWQIESEYEQSLRFLERHMPIIPPLIFRVRLPWRMR